MIKCYKPIQHSLHLEETEQKSKKNQRQRYIRKCLREEKKRRDSVLERERGSVMKCKIAQCDRIQIYHEKGLFGQILHIAKSLDLCV